ncbi:RsmD family RNA methyltransferase [Limibaculum sp. FT325]|uniref:RsmD family RNA methyltransferase n=1 Tax=Thermohalobaculum sediminis TaxID=2939436 RepID=UPI0020BF1AFB|nr:RsmD family RNA methyltransferase [Limibaculum sediminis]MCL5777920.1 RsmD family RNA methyltransferase [Limibaculum sediminis]
MRVIGGRFRGARIAAPGAAGGGEAHLRPTSDRVREALFNLLAHGGYADPPVPEGAHVLDLFAGTGALGVEALSRGAIRAVFVDDHGPSRALIRETVERLGLGGVTKIWRRDATRLGPCRGEPFDLVFADPPYGTDLGIRALASAREGGWLAPGALVVLEGRAGDPLPAFDWLEPLDTRQYGETRIAIFRAV